MGGGIYINISIENHGIHGTGVSFVCGPYGVGWCVTDPSPRCDHWVLSYDVVGIAIVVVAIMIAGGGRTDGSGGTFYHIHRHRERYRTIRTAGRSTIGCGQVDTARY